VTNRYLGLKFVITGKVHFGWARLNVSCSSQGSTITALLTGYAYETVPNQPIVTGREKSKDISEGATLGRLAKGAGLSPWRGKNRQ
jgi:hypothetical protein